MATNFAFLVAIISINLLLGPICLAVARGERGLRALRDWGWGMLAYATGLLVQVSTLTRPHPLSFFVGTSLIGLAPAICFRGVLSYTPFRLQRRWVGAALGGFFALMAANNFGGAPSTTINIFAPTLVAIVFFAVGAALLFAAPPADARRAARFTSLSMLYAVALWSVRLLFLSGAWPSLASPERAELVRSLLAVGHIVGTVACTLSLFAIEVRKMETELTVMALSDALTGLPNRRSTTERFGQEVARARRLRRPFAMLLVDIDHFKRINDDHGHLAGDALLRHVAEVLGSASRTEDALGRIGGEEFVLLLQQPGLADALAIADRIRGAVADAPLEYDGRTLSATVSVGLALFPTDGGDWDALFACADERLYASKRGGRNRVTGPAALDARQPEPAASV